MKTNPIHGAFATSNDHNHQHGLTKREYFASKAPIKELLGMYCDRPCGTVEECADMAVAFADALIKKLNKEISNE